MRHIGIVFVALVVLGFVLAQPADAGWRHCGGCYGVCDGWGCFGYRGLCASCYTPSYTGCGSWSGCSTCCCGGYTAGYGGYANYGGGGTGSAYVQPGNPPAPPAAPSMPAPPPAPGH